MSEKRRGLGRGLGALIPSAPPTGTSRPTDVFFKDNRTIGHPGPGRSSEQQSGSASPRQGSGDGASTSAEEARFTGNTTPSDSTVIEARNPPADRDEAGLPAQGDTHGDGFTGNNTPKGEGDPRSDRGLDDAGRLEGRPVDAERLTRVDADGDAGPGAQQVTADDGSAGGGSGTSGADARAAAEDGHAAQADSAQAYSARADDAARRALDELGEAHGDDPTTDEDLAPVPGATFAEVPVTSIRPNPRQPRQVFDDDEMAELVHSIREIGVLQPIVVRSVTVDDEDGPERAVTGTTTGDALDEDMSASERISDEARDPATAAGSAIRFELIMGERRWRAAQQAGLETVPAIIKDTSDDDLLRDALLENLHRSQLNPLEEAAAYQQLLDDFGCTHEELAGRIGRSRPQISNTLRLLRLPPLVARRVAAGVLSAGHARALLALPDSAAMERMAQRIVAEGLSVRSVEETVAVGGPEAPKRRSSGPRPGDRHPQLDDLAARLSDRFDTRVNISLGKRKGKLTVEFASVDDLNRILDLLAPEDDVPA